jgi:hypothetical protein
MYWLHYGPNFFEFFLFPFTYNGCEGVQYNLQVREKTILNMWTNYPMKAILFLWHGQDQEIWMDIEHLPHYESHLMFKCHLFPGTWTIERLI